MTNSEISRILDKLAFFLSLKNESEPKINAYRRASKSISKHTRQIEEMLLAGDELTGIPGIGKIIAKKIEDMLIIGEDEFLRPYRCENPDSLWELARIKGIGPRTILRMYSEHGISSIGELQDFLEGGGKLDLQSGLEEKISEYFKQ